MQRDTDANDWIEIDRLKIEHAKQNIAFLKPVLVFNSGQFLSDTPFPVYLPKAQTTVEALSTVRCVVSDDGQGPIDTTLQPRAS